MLFFETYVRINSMKVNEPKVKDTSEYYMCSSSDTDRKLRFYPVCVGEYDYMPEYSMTRNSFDSFLFMEIAQGECTVWYDNENHPGKMGDLFLIDCYQPHGYFTTTGYTAKWLHFDGPMARAYFEELARLSMGSIEGKAGEVNESMPTGLVCKTGKKYSEVFEKLISQLREEKNADIGDFHTRLTGLLDTLVSGEYSVPMKKNTETIGDVLAYINANFHRELTIEEMAEYSHLSPFYFTRLFKKLTGATPHEYILKVRIDHARYLLATSTLTIKEICFACGYASESRFCTSFKNICGYTPSEYRNGVKVN